MKAAAVVPDIAAALKTYDDAVNAIPAAFRNVIVAAVAAIVIGLPALRLRGDYLAIATLGFGEITYNLLTIAIKDALKINDTAYSIPAEARRSFTASRRPSLGSARFTESMGWRDTGSRHHISLRSAYDLIVNCHLKLVMPRESVPSTPFCAEQSKAWMLGLRRA